MEAFDDENPFDTESDRIPSETSSTSKVDISEPPSPPFNPSRQLSSEITSPERTFPSQPPRQPQRSNFKSDFCCARDRILHSGDDVEILVCAMVISYYAFLGIETSTCKITDAQKTNLGATTPYITYVIQTGVSC